MLISSAVGRLMGERMTRRDIVDEILSSAETDIQMACMYQAEAAGKLRALMQMSVASYKPYSSDPNQQEAFLRGVQWAQRLLDQLPLL